MGGLAILGSLAGGYSDAQHRDKVLNLEQEKQQRDLQSSLALKLLSDPSVPSEYKGALAQFGMDSVTSKKLPKFDDLIKSLPSLKNPAFNTPGTTPQTGAVPMGAASQTIQLPLPPGSNGAPTPAGQVGATGGGLSIPGIPVSAPNLSSQPVAMPAPPPPLAQAGQMHFLSPSEQESAQAQALISKAKAISAATGIPEDRVLGFGEKWIQTWQGPMNVYTGEVSNPEGAHHIVKTQPWTLPNGGSTVVQQDPTGHYWYNGKEMVPGVDGNPVTAGMITQSAPTTRTGSSQYNADTGVTTTSSTSKKDFGPSVKSPTEPPGTVRAIQNRTSSTSTGPVTPAKLNTAAPLDRPALTGGRVPAMARMWATTGNKPGAKDLPAVTKYMDDNGILPMVKLPPGEGRGLSVAFNDMQDSQNRLNVMKSDIDQIAKNPANAGSFDMDLLSQHIAMTFGSVKGIRTSQQLIQHHLDARSLPESLSVIAQKVMRGDQLSPEQRANFVHLAEQRVGSAQSKYSGLAQNLGQRYGQNAFGLQAPSAPPSPQSSQASPNSNYEGYAVDPSNGHRIGARGGKWYDVTTGVPIQ